MSRPFFSDRTDKILFWLAISYTTAAITLGALISPDLGLGLSLGACALVAARFVHRRARRRQGVVNGDIRATGEVRDVRVNGLVIADGPHVVVRNCTFGVGRTAA